MEKGTGECVRRAWGMPNKLTWIIKWQLQIIMFPINKGTANELRPLYIFTCWKIHTTSRCSNHIYTLPPKLSSIWKKNSDQVWFSACSHAAFWKERMQNTKKQLKNIKTHMKMSDSVCNDLYTHLCIQQHVETQRFLIFCCVMICMHRIWTCALFTSRRHSEVQFNASREPALSFSLFVTQFLIASGAREAECIFYEKKIV